MTPCAPGARLFLLLLLAISFLGCSQFKGGAVSEEKDPHFLEARNRQKAMDWDGAIDSFERALQNNPTNAAAHFELGVLYDTRKKDYVAAMYHYQKHIQLRPNSPSAGRAAQNIVGCKRELFKTASFEFVPRDFQVELERFSKTNALLTNVIAQLKSDLARRPMYLTNYVTNFVRVPTFEARGSSRLTQPAALVEPPDSFPEPIPEPIPEPEPAAEPESARQPRPAQVRSTPPAAQQARPSERAERPKPAASRKTHRVRPGDTLEVIARKYGVSVSALKAANPSARRGARAGQQLAIP